MCSLYSKRNGEVTILEKQSRWLNSLLKKSFSFLIFFKKWGQDSWQSKLNQVVPHITDAIKEWIESVSQIPVDGKQGPADVCVIELGGTVGKI